MRFISVFVVVLVVGVGVVVVLLHRDGVCQCVSVFV